MQSLFVTSRHVIAQPLTQSIALVGGFKQPDMKAIVGGFDLFVAFNTVRWRRRFGRRILE